jgi:hypothetical protein
MLMLMSILACGDKTTDTSISETAAEPVDTADTTDTTDTEEPPIPFAPMNGHWTYSGGELIEAGTTCQLDSATEGELTDPVGFNLTASDGGFTVMADDATDNGTVCTMVDPESPDAGGFMCANSTTEITFEDVDMVIVTADIDMSIDTSTTGVFADSASLTNTFTLTLNCLDVRHDFGGSCGDITDAFPTPCTIQFTANATLDQ